MGERRSRILRDKRGVASQDSPQQEGGGARLRFDQLGMRASQLKLPYYRSANGKEEAGGR